MSEFSYECKTLHMSIKNVSETLAIDLKDVLKKLTDIAQKNPSNLQHYKNLLATLIALQERKDSVGADELNESRLKPILNNLKKATESNPDDSTIMFYLNIGTMLDQLIQMQTLIQKLPNDDYKKSASTVHNTFYASLKHDTMRPSEQAFMLKAATQVNAILAGKFDDTTLDDLKETTNEISLFDEKLYIALSIFLIVASIGVGVVPLAVGITFDIMVLSILGGVLGIMAGTFATCLSISFTFSQIDNFIQSKNEKQKANDQEPLRKAINTLIDTPRLRLFDNDKNDDKQSLGNVPKVFLQSSLS